MDQPSPSNVRFRTGYIITHKACRRHLEEGMKKDFGWVEPAPQLQRDPSESDEEWQRRHHKIKHYYKHDLSRIYRTCFLDVHLKAPLEVRTQLVVVHGMIRSRRCPTHGDCLKTACFVPTGRGSGLDQPEPTELDRIRLELFIQGYNSLIQDPERRASAGLTEGDFKFVSLQRGDIFRPPFSNTKIEEMRAADRATWDLYGLSRREFAYSYLQRR